MKKIICLVLIALMSFSVLSFSAFAIDSEAVSAKATYKVEWSKHNYETYWYKNLMNDYTELFDVTLTENIISSAGKSTEKLRRTYISQEKFAINEQTEFEYVFEAKNNFEALYAGAVFAFAQDTPYIIFGAFDNRAESGEELSDIRLVKGLNKHDTLDCSTGFEQASLKVAVSDDGFGTFKIVYDGYDVSVYGLTDAQSGTYEKLGNTVTLPSDAKIAFGVFSYSANEVDDLERDRTLTVRNAVLYAMNDDAARVIDPSYGEKQIAVMLEELKAAIDAAEALKESDYTADSYQSLSEALKSANGLLDDTSVTAAQIEEAILGIENAKSALEKQTEKATEDITDAPETDAPIPNVTESATDAAITDAEVKPSPKKCASTLSVSALVLVSVIGTALIFKKKD